LAFWVAALIFSWPPVVLNHNRQYLNPAFCAASGSKNPLTSTRIGSSLFLQSAQNLKPILMAHFFGIGVGVVNNGFDLVVIQFMDDINDFGISFVLLRLDRCRINCFKAAGLTRFWQKAILVLL